MGGRGRLMARPRKDRPMGHPHRDRPTARRLRDSLMGHPLTRIFHQISIMIRDHPLPGRE